MAQMQRISFLSRRLSFKFKHVYLNCSQRNQALHIQNIMALSTVGPVNLNLFHNLAVENIERPIRQFCSLATNENVEQQELMDANAKPFLKSLSQVNLSEGDLMNTFKSLLLVYKYNRSRRTPNFDIELERFIASKEFTDYCNVLEGKLPILSNQELRLLLNLCHFKVSPSSALMQKIYHLIVEKINDYGPVDVLAIYELINSDEHKKNPRSNILNMICEKYMMSGLFRKAFHTQDYNQLVVFLKALEIPIEVKKMLLSHFAKNFEKIRHELTLQSLCRLFGAVSLPSLQSRFVPEVFEELKSRMSKNMTLMQMKIVLNSYKRLRPRMISYDECFLNTLVEIMLENKPSIITTIEFIMKFLDMRFMPTPLIKHLESKFADPDFVLKFQQFALNVAKILAAAYYHPMGYTGDDSNHIESIKKLDSFDFKNEFNLPKRNNNMDAFANWCLYLTVLGSQRKVELLNKLFTLLVDTYEKGNSSAFADDLSLSTIESIIALHAFARRNFPKDVIELPETFLKKCHDHLQNDITKGYHKSFCQSFNSMTVLEYCTTSNHHVIDFAILLDENGKPQEIEFDSKNKSSDILNIENIKRPPLSKLILYLIYRGQLPYEMKNSVNLPGTVQLYLQSFEELDCQVVLFQLKKLRKLNEKNLVSFVQKNISKSLGR